MGLVEPSHQSRHAWAHTSNSAGHITAGLARGYSGMVREVEDRKQEDSETGMVRTPDGRRLAFCEWGDPQGARCFISMAFGIRVV